MEELLRVILPIVIVGVIVIYWIILPIYRKVTGKSPNKPAHIKEEDFFNKLYSSTNQDELFEMFVATNEMDKEQMLMERFTDDSVLLKIILNSNKCEYKHLAAKKLNNEESFVKLAESQVDKEIRMLALDKIKNNSVLQKLAQKENDNECLLKIIEKTGDVNILPEDTILELVNHTSNNKLLSILISGLKSEKAFYTVAKSGIKKDFRVKAVKSISDEESLLKIVLSSDGDEVKLCALDKIKDENNLAEICKSKSEKEIKLPAYQNISNEEMLKQLLLKENNIELLVSYFQANYEKLEIFKNDYESESSLPIKLILLENSFKDTVENSKILESIFTKDVLKVYAQILSAKTENENLKQEILKRHKQIKQQCDKIIERSEDRYSEVSKPESLIELVDIFSSYNDLFVTFKNPESMVQFLSLYNEYSGIYDIGDYFYSERDKFLDDYIASNNLTEMTQVITEERYDIRKLDFEGTPSIYDLLKETLELSDWWSEAVVKAWFASLTLHFVDKTQSYFPQFIIEMTKGLVPTATDNFGKRVFNIFVNTNFSFLSDEKSDEYFQEDFLNYQGEYVWQQFV